MIINLSDYILERINTVSDTMSRDEINSLLEDIANFELWEIVSVLPTEDIKVNKLYLVPNNESVEHNLFDVFVYVDDEWEQLDSLSFNIQDYYTISQIEELLNSKANLNQLENLNLDLITVRDNLTNLYTNIINFNEVLIDFEEDNDNSSTDLSKLNNNLDLIRQRFSTLLDDFNILSDEFGDVSTDLNDAQGVIAQLQEDKANKSDISSIGYSGDYNDLNEFPILKVSPSFSIDGGTILVIDTNESTDTLHGDCFILFDMCDNNYSDNLSISIEISNVSSSPSSKLLVDTGGSSIDYSQVKGLKNILVYISSDYTYTLITPNFDIPIHNHGRIDGNGVLKTGTGYVDGNKILVSDSDGEIYGSSHLTDANITHTGKLNYISNINNPNQSEINTAINTFFGNLNNFIDSVEIKNNKVGSWSDNVNDNHYPSEKLVKDTFDTKQATLVSGTNIKTVNGNSLLGSGDIVINTNGVIDDNVTSNSDNPVKSSGIYTALSEKANTTESQLNNAMATNFSEVTNTTKDILQSLIEKLHSTMLYIEDIKEGLSDEDFQSFGSFMNKFGDILAIVEDVYNEIDNTVLSHNNNSNAHSDIRSALNGKADASDFSTVEVVVRYTDNTTETLTLYSQNN